MTHATYLITGASSGLGLELARQLARQGAGRLILPMRDPVRAGDALALVHEAGARHVLTPELDLASLANVRAFTRSLPALLGTRRLDGVLLNAGVQAAGQLRYTADHLEATFAVNHLAHHLLARHLLPHLAPGAAMGWTASGTHDPCELSGRLFGFRGARYRSVAQLAQGDDDLTTRGAQRCRDAYATSKLCNVVSARGFASEHGERARFFAFDPGLMPGTGLARAQPGWAQATWQHVLPRMVPFLPGASTPERSAAVLVQLLTGAWQAQRHRQGHSPNGVYVDFRGHERRPSRLARAPWVQRDLMQGSDALLTPGRSGPRS
jgi:protochlorophyllide reductase